MKTVAKTSKVMAERHRSEAFMVANCTTNWFQPNRRESNSRWWWLALAPGGVRRIRAALRLVARHAGSARSRQRTRADAAPGYAPPPTTGRHRTHEPAPP